MSANVNVLLWPFPLFDVAENGLSGPCEMLTSTHICISTHTIFITFNETLRKLNTDVWGIRNKIPKEMWIIIILRRMKEG